MGYGVYEIDNERFGGYGVPAYCGHPECNKEIDRGIYYKCGEGRGSNEGCEMFFCGDHLFYREGNQLCSQCLNDLPPHPQKPEHPKWIRHILEDKTWQEWRNLNKDTVKIYRKLLNNKEEV